MRTIFAVILALVLAACASTSAPSAGARRTIDIAAEQWVRIALEIDTYEEGYVDAYFGPGEWRERARANPRTVVELTAATGHLGSVLRAVAVNDTDQQTQQRARFLIAQVDSASFRLSMIGGARASFREEAERLFAFPLVLRPLESYDAALARVEALLPGDGAAHERMAALLDRTTIPAERLRPVMERAIAECRARTAARYDLPANEAFRIEFVNGQSWGAYNWYQGGHRSLIQVNTDHPPTIASALVYGCHEGYPGHHVQGIYNERHYRENGWVEYALAPLYGPASPLAEGAGNYGVTLAFPGDERMIFERDVLSPMAGLDPSAAMQANALFEAMSELEGVGVTIQAMFLDGEIDRERAIALLQRYELNSREGAEQSLRFAEHYRAYIINYEMGEALVRTYVERVGDAPAERWAAFERIMTEPTLPTDLMP